MSVKYMSQKPYGEQGFIYLLGFKILYIYIILLRHLAMWTSYTNRTVNSEIQD